MQIDQILKEFWEDNERFADFFNTVFFKGQPMILPAELETISADLSLSAGTKQGLEGITKYRDKVKLWKGTLLAILGLENQEKIHYAMPERVMLNDALQYEQQRKAIASRHRRDRDLKNGCEYLSRFAKTDRMYPVLTAVIYYGEEPWDGPLCLKEMVQLPQALTPFFNDYQMYLFQVLGNDGSAFANNDIRTILRNAHALRSKRICDLDDTLDAEMCKFLAGFVNSEKIYKLSEQKGELAMCTALNEMIEEGEKRGERRGEKRGIRKGKAESILMLLKDLGSVPAELSKRIMDETDLDSLNRWLKQAACANSIAQFQAAIGYTAMQGNFAR